MTTMNQEIQTQSRRVSNHDRRVNHRRAALLSIYRGRRRVNRRDGDSHVNQYVDVHDRKVAVFAIGIFIFSICDALFTTTLISHGSYELNPLMDYALQKDFHVFFTTKHSITFFCIAALVMHRNHTLFNRFSGYQLLVAAFAVYTLLVSYEVFMVYHLMTA